MASKRVQSTCSVVSETGAPSIMSKDSLNRAASRDVTVEFFYQLSKAFTAKVESLVPPHPCIGSSAAEEEATPLPGVMDLLAVSGSDDEAEAAEADVPSNQDISSLKAQESMEAKTAASDSAVDEKTAERIIEPSLGGLAYPSCVSGGFYVCDAIDMTTSKAHHDRAILSFSDDEEDIESVDLLNDKCQNDNVNTTRQMSKKMISFSENKEYHTFESPREESYDSPTNPISISESIDEYTKMQDHALLQKLASVKEHLSSEQMLELSKAPKGSEENEFYTAISRAAMINAEVQAKRAQLELKRIELENKRVEEEIRSLDNDLRYTPRLQESYDGSEFTEESEDGLPNPKDAVLVSANYIANKLADLQWRCGAN